MKFHRFIGNFDFSKQRINIADPEILNQTVKVLRLKIGNHLILSDGKGQDAVMEIIGLDKKSLGLKVVSVQENNKDPERRAVLYCSVLKRENFELVVQKATEIGVKEIVPLITKRTIKLNLKMDRLEKIIREAAEQSGRAMVPILHKPMIFEAAMEQAEDNDINFFFDFRGQPWKPVSSDSKKIGIFIGPEGGWDESEVKFVMGDLKEKFLMVNLGLLTLRAETAAIIASYLILQ